MGDECMGVGVCMGLRYIGIDEYIVILWVKGVGGGAGREKERWKGVEEGLLVQEEEEELQRKIIMINDVFKVYVFEYLYFYARPWFVFELFMWRNLSSFKCESNRNEKLDSRV